MKHGFIKVAAATPEVKVADCIWNGEQTIKLIEEAEEQGVKVLVFPELGITGYTCGDLFLQDTLLDVAQKTMWKIVESTEGKDVFVFVGLPLQVRDKLYNVAAAIQNGELLGLIPKQYIPNYSEFYEARHFHAGPAETADIFVDGLLVPFGQNIIFTCEELGMTLAAEICEDLWTRIPPSNLHALAGANVIVNLSASNELVGKGTRRRNLVKGQSSQLLAAYIYACAGEGESTTDSVFAGHNMIAENGKILAEKRFATGLCVSEIDVQKLRSERRRIGSFMTEEREDYTEIIFKYPTLANGVPETELTRPVAKSPFVPADAARCRERAEEITMIQALGLKKRLQHTGCKSAVIGISGGLDSTLALLITCKAFDLSGIPRNGITSVTMPCFGTTDRTYNNALALARELGTTVREVNIAQSVRKHFEDIGHDEAKHDVTYENSQARERTQVLMDIANQLGGMVIGTGDLSELALGWATYNGDHMSMYGVNADIPKTLVRFLVAFFAEEAETPTLAAVLKDILDTPVSPELLPPTDGQISQKTEDLVGPYELHDFFLYYMLRFGFAPKKIFRLAKHAFVGEYEDAVILKWLKTFYRRFFSQQFKRSCLPDGPKVGSVGVSPRGDLRMPSDACVRLWLEELEGLENC
ncbi:MAG: NAD(+) synthase [Lachnospiraceae bacterium]|nr:NAD(+) synthase [Lachnospiraceae bacterium]